MVFISPAVSGRRSLWEIMEKVKVIELKESVLKDNDADADKLRLELKEKNTYFINVMSAPGSGKTSALTALDKYFKGRIKWGVIEADIDSDVDAVALNNAGIISVQAHTGGMCHLDADMARQGIRQLDGYELDLIVLENIGNLVCPAEFDTGANLKLTILSVPEGDDKPAKYPLMYEVSDVLVINKVDALAAFDFDKSRVESDVRALNPDIKIFYISAKTGEGVEELAAYILDKIREYRG
jgi:hydrogenase nickel incorporation protein HypB